MTGRCGVVVAHGTLAEGLLSALERVTGPHDNLWALSNDGRSGPALAEAVGELLAARSGDREAYLFADLGGGSCGQACQRLVDSGKARALFTGVNLPLLFEFVFLQDQPHEKLVAALVTKSRNAIAVHP